MAGKAVRLWWVSWHQPTEDFRPLTDPPNANVIGWWCSGYDSDDIATLCGVVLGRDEDQAKASICKSWPEACRWRFCEEKALTWKPGDRFPITHDWVKERFANLVS